MKIAIQGHKTRGQEVIKILESLGGKQGFLPLKGNNDSLIYFINKPLNNLISSGVVSYFEDYKVYTLEEFEKEFPFKIGDCVQIKTERKIHLATIIDIVDADTYKVKYPSGGGIGFINKKYITIQKEMKERNITLTLEKAKEWYNNGGELKEVALQAFTEQELNPLPKSWEEFLKNHCSEWKKGILESALKDMGYYFPGEKLSKFKALLQLEYLRDCYRQGWVPDSKPNTWAIWNNKKSLEIGYLYGNTFLSFQSEKVAKEFLKNFEPLIKEAGDLI